MKNIRKNFTLLFITAVLVSACGNSNSAVAESSRAREKNPNVSDAELNALV